MFLYLLFLLSQNAMAFDHNKARWLEKAYQDNKMIPVLDLESAPLESQPSMTYPGYEGQHLISCKQQKNALTKLLSTTAHELKFKKYLPYLNILQATNNPQDKKKAYLHLHRFLPKKNAPSLLISDFAVLYHSLKTPYFNRYEDPHLDLIRSYVISLTEDKKCQDAENLTDSIPHILNDAEIVSKLATCYRRHYKRFIPHYERLTKKISTNTLQGYLDLELVKYHWNRDQFQKASALLNQTSFVAQQSLSPKLEEETALLDIEIKINQGDYPSAHKAMSTFLIRHPRSPQKPFIYRHLMLAAARSENWSSLNEYASSLIYSLPLALKTDHDSLFLFANFWKGLSELHLGLPDKAQASLTQVISYHRTSYYGGLSLYLMEYFSLPYDQITPKLNPLSLPPHLSDEEKKDLLLTLKSSSLTVKTCILNGIVIHPSDNPTILSVSHLRSISGLHQQAIETFRMLEPSFTGQLTANTERILFPIRFLDPIFSAASSLGQDPLLLLSLIRQESLFLPNARSNKNAFGLMQLIPNTAKTEIQRLPPALRARVNQKLASYHHNLPRALFDPTVNLLAGTRHLKGLLHRHDSLIVALAAYNAGHRKITEWLSRFPSSHPLVFVEMIPFQETRDYVKLILRNYYFYRHHLTKLDSSLVQHDALKPLFLLDQDDPWIHQKLRISQTPSSTPAQH